MRTSLSFLVLCAISLVLVLMAVAYYLFSKINANEPETGKTGTTASADSIRVHAVTDLASKISYLASDTTILWPTEWQQIGTARSGCQLATRHCLIEKNECFDLQSFSKNKFKMPVDVVLGSSEMTGYALKKSDTVLEIAACYGEGMTPITQELRF